MSHLLRGVIGSLRILLHHATCRLANATATVTHTDAGRIFECGCGYGIWEAY